MESYASFFLLLAVVSVGAGVVFLIKKFGKRQSVTSFHHELPGTRDPDTRFTLTMPEDGLQDAAHHFSPPPSKKVLDDTLLVLSVMAKPGARFASYDLLQAISSAGLQFGEMNIFHYVYPETNYGIKLFSLASAEEPGEFNLDNMGNFTCPGLMLFMDSARVPDPRAAFSIMLEKAERLADDLDGELFADPQTPWNDDICATYQSRVMELSSAHPVL